MNPNYELKPNYESYFWRNNTNNINNMQTIYYIDETCATSLIKMTFLVL